MNYNSTVKFYLKNRSQQVFFLNKPNCFFFLCTVYIVLPPFCLRSVSKSLVLGRWFYLYAFTVQSHTCLSPWVNLEERNPIAWILSWFIRGFFARVEVSYYFSSIVQSLLYKKKKNKNSMKRVINFTPFQIFKISQKCSVCPSSRSSSSLLAVCLGYEYITWS